MSEEQNSCSGMCEAYGCPLPGSFGSDGKWWCVCHCHCNPANTQGITAMLRRHKALVDAALQARRGHCDQRVIAEAEHALLDLIPEVQAAVQKKASVIPMPTTPATYHPYADEIAKDDES